MSTALKSLLLFLVMLLTITACAQGPSASEGNGGGPANPERANIRIVVVTHGQAADPFWAVVRKGVEQAAKDMGVQVDYRAPETFDINLMARMIDEAVASKPSGLVVSIPDATVLGPSIQRAVKAGIPVISINSGSEVAEKLGLLAHVGQTEYEAGFGGGERMGASGVKNALCVNQEVGNAALDLRCRGFADALAKIGGTVKVVPITVSDPADAQQRISTALADDPGIDGILALGPTGALPALNVLEEKNLVGKVKLASFDLSPEILDAIQKGDMLFAIDQQQYLQGYLPIVLLTLHMTNLNTLGNKIVMTGPGFVTSDNAARVLELSREGTR